ncbi:MAG: iron-containing redox enzyme family protein [Methylocystis sp.]
MIALEPDGPLSTLSEDELHQRLAELNARRFTPTTPTEGWRTAIKLFEEDVLLEGAFLERELDLAAEHCRHCPTDPRGFIAWFEELRWTGPGQFDPLFDWLARAASPHQMRWFLAQEVAGEAGFEDLTALTQVRFPTRVKLELARNFWDEMGRGQAKGMHGPMLARLAEALDLKPSAQTTVWEALALANTMAGLAANRRYAYHSVGALGVVELTAPDRSAAVAAGLKRLGIPSGDRHYFDLHAVLDVKHSASWNAEAIAPLVEEGPSIARAIAQGAIMRLLAGRRCFERYKRQFGLQAAAA